ncbi:hypothetical protein Psta_3881 [Pirellula staleyi DSM 6068]|uniref:Carboxypeptidase regulatory-like domain-containing protein n=1 Tax=Pirellula staleyi (strain ATCC 27377 / DSM 6068 / ICPB 4128) TaxID=530564 RepID=D2R151_PIRSD|nr:carboxypeptidase-like regulatory domain-containing protein [Pirellula staleyi]ADB18536.1 hypothetical protein Psta_3881 [Pirellula staleyi DSM 6068]
MRSLASSVGRRAVVIGLVACFALITTGCGSSGMVQVAGVVTLDGQPVEGAAVMFMPAEGRPAEGYTDATGNFLLQTQTPGDGVAPGVYRVTVVKTKVYGVEVNEDGTSGAFNPAAFREEFLVPKKYSMPDTSGLEYTIEPGMASLKLELTSK